MRSRRRMLGVTAAMAVTLVAGSGVASGSAPTPAQKKTFSVLDRKPAKVVPAAVKSFIREDIGRQFGVDAAHVYRVPAPAGGVWSVLPGSKNRVCIVFETKENVSACGTLEQANVGAISMLLIAPDSKGGDPTGPATGRRTYIGYVPPALAPSLTKSAGLSAGIKSGFYEVVGENTRLSSVLSGFSRRARALETRRAGVSAPKAKAAGQTWSCIPTEPRYNCAYTWYSVAGTYGWQSLLFRVTVTSYDGNWICGNARAGSGPWAGAFACTNNNIAGAHPYDGSPRSSWAGPGNGSASGIGTAVMSYYTIP